MCWELDFEPPQFTSTFDIVSRKPFWGVAFPSPQMCISETKQFFVNRLLLTVVRCRGNNTCGSAKIPGHVQCMMSNKSFSAQSQMYFKLIFLDKYVHGSFLLDVLFINVVWDRHELTAKTEVYVWAEPWFALLPLGSCPTEVVC